MTAAKSGHHITSSDVSIVIGMANRGDRNHDIAAWFGVNQGRIKETKDGKYGPPVAAPSSKLPPKGAPGIKGRRLHIAVKHALAEAKKPGAGLPDVIKILEEAVKRYESNET
ncbi:hypothetical protein PY365_30565 [Roseiarcaceae bacterium H3SJ34-1]|uniref:hypothetical protein n=1 Tax=Terripilifer ovatus TaxID=3032367 RepID=UPI003AB995AA|nr:hypothetical protein [Roseiarcaceae bacterium H3SJ34-1]